MVNVRVRADPNEEKQGEGASYMTPPTATRTPEPQRLRALERANEIRLARASLKRRIALGDVSAAEVLLTCPSEAASWSVGDLLISQRRWGTTRCRKFLSRNYIIETKQIGTLTDRQRRILAAALQAATEAPPAGLVHDGARGDMVLVGA